MLKGEGIQSWNGLCTRQNQNPPWSLLAETHLELERAGRVNSQSEARAGCREQDERVCVSENHFLLEILGV